MSNVLGNYDQQWFANEALIQLHAKLGMASRVHRGYDPTPQAKGAQIQIRRPGTFTAEDAPSTAQDAKTDSLTITLNQWKEVKTKWTDKELSLSAPEIISDHIEPMMRALAQNVDVALNGLRKFVPWFYDLGASPSAADITGLKKVMRDNKVPLEDIDLMHLEIDSTLEDRFTSLAAFSQSQGAGEAGVALQTDGIIGRKYGLNVFPNQNVQTHTSGTVVSAGTDVLGALDGDHAAGVSTVLIDGLSGSETLVAGDSFKFASHDQRYVLTAGATLSSGAASMSIFPALKVDVANNVVATFENGSGSSVHAASYSANLAFHRNAFALATAPLSELGDGQGATIRVAVDPVTKLALRSRTFYVPNESAYYLAFDILYAVACLDPNLAAILRRDV